jgi:hypothetical protein
MKPRNIIWCEKITLNVKGSRGLSLSRPTKGLQLIEQCLWCVEAPLHYSFSLILRCCFFENKGRVNMI